MTITSVVLYVLQAAFSIIAVYCIYMSIRLRYRQKLQNQFREHFADYKGKSPWEDGGIELKEFLRHQLQHQREKTMIYQQEIERIRMILFYPNDPNHRNINWQKKQENIYDAISYREFVNDFNRKVRLAKDMGFDVCAPVS